MDRYTSEVEKLIRQHNGELVRSNKHLVWRFPDGRTFVAAKTPGDWRASRVQLSDLRKTLGVQDPERGQPGERRERKRTSAERPHQWRSEPTVNLALRDKLLLSGLVDEVRHGEIDRLTAQVALLERENGLLRRKSDRLRTLLEGLWFVGLARKLRILRRMTVDHSCRIA